MQEIYEEFQTQFTTVTIDLYKIGLAKKDERDEEEAQFVLCLEKAKEGTRKEGESIMADLFKEKNHTFSEITRLAQRLEGGGTVKPDAKETETGNGDLGGALLEVSTLGEEEFEGEELVARMQMLGEEFKDHCHKAWSQLMALETHLYEQIEDTISTFERNLSELVASFIESAQVHFVSCREFEVQFHEKIATAAPRYFAATRARIAAYNAKVFIHEESESSEQNLESVHDQNGDVKDDCPTVPSILEQCLENKDALQNMLISSHDSHLQIIDGREDTLVSEARGWLKEKLEKYTRDEVEGNRKRLHEIITVTNLLREELEELQESSISLPMLAEMEIMEG
ncbi:dynein regulatory complex subunit 3-like [Hetaerina americana]|uniref:dynein regulatory complex subunit 3-like n=1 Tax=Hetaerina americana TaxID=62018 RepID=UPI003A7F4AF8